MKVKKATNTTVKKKNTKGSKAKKSEEPWVKVLNMNVNPDNPRNGFFELDWNDEFVNNRLKRLLIDGSKPFVEQSVTSKA
jgi:hypothetical protein